MTAHPLISLVCPFFQEEAVIPAFFERLTAVLAGQDLRVEIVCVNDGSSDGTLAALQAAQQRHPGVVVVDLSRNFGKEAALTAGIDLATGDAVIPIDADLQDPPELILQMIEQWRAGYEVVLARRVDRSTDIFSKRLSAALFYKVHNLLSETKIPENVGDFRLMDRVVVEALKRLPERRRFMKGLFAWVGFKTACIDYARAERVAGESKFNGWRLWNFAIEGITGFSIAPLKFWTYTGSIIALTSLVYASWIVIRTLVFGIVLPGYASLLVAILFLGGVQLVGIGLLGEYVGRVYVETKQRPVYVIRKVYPA